MSNPADISANAAPEGAAEAAKIAALNDAFRKSFAAHGERYITDGILAFSDDDRAIILQLVRDFDAFDDGNDPHGERDFGAFDFKGERIFWKIDYYDRAKRYGSDNPADPAQTCRVLTILLAEEY